MNSEVMLKLGAALLMIAMSILTPLAIIVSLNVLFHTNIEIKFTTWLAAYILTTQFTQSTKKD